MKRRERIHRPRFISPPELQAALGLMRLFPSASAALNTPTLPCYGIPRRAFATGTPSDVSERAATTPPLTPQGVAETTSLLTEQQDLSEGDQRTKDAK
jgi:hypothetical protein